MKRIAFWVFLGFYLTFKTHGYKDIFSCSRPKNKFSKSVKHEILEEIKEMFYFGYDNYMKHAYPEDELNPIFCKGRGPDHLNPDNININDVLGDYQLTLIDTLDTLAILGNSSEFKRAVNLVIRSVSFEKDTTVQVFEATIRVIGALLSAHLIATDPKQSLGPTRPPAYSDELLHLARDLAGRLLSAFDSTATGIPHPRVHLSQGLPTLPGPGLTNETCLAGAGSLLLEFATLSRLAGDPIFEAAAKRSVRALWQLRSNVTGLLGNIVNVQSGKWTGSMSGLGAGLDSFYEYLLKVHIILGESEYLEMFREAVESIRFHQKRGRRWCTKGHGTPPFYVNVDMWTGDLDNYWMDALQAAWPGVLVLNGDIDEAICLHAMYYAIWRKYGLLPERFNWYSRMPEVKFYPLRPELAESTYLLYQATKNPFYLQVGWDILQGLQNYTRAKCGYATVHDVTEMSLEDRMESFFLSETCKYLYLLFDEHNPVNLDAENYLFTTEGHLFPIRRLRKLNQAPLFGVNGHRKAHRRKEADLRPPQSQATCENVPYTKRFVPPLADHYMEQIFNFVGLEPHKT